MRLFTSIEIPESAHEHILAIQREVMRHALAGKADPRENFHLTLHFLGEVPESRLPELIALIDATQSPRFSLRFENVGRFTQKKLDTPSGRAVSALWWVAPNKNPQLNAVQRELGQRLSEAGFPTPDRVFHPHLTLARRVILAGGDKQSHRHSTSAQLAMAKLKRMPDDVCTDTLPWPDRLEEPFEIEVDGIRLMSSDLSKGTPVYREVHRVTWA